MSRGTVPVKSLSGATLQPRLKLQSKKDTIRVEVEISGNMPSAQKHLDSSTDGREMKFVPDLLFMYKPIGNATGQLNLGIMGYFS
jgi:hypothetical protein